MRGFRHFPKITKASIFLLGIILLLLSVDCQKTNSLGLEQTFARSLRGGSYSRGGYSGGGSRSSYHNNNYNYHRSNNFNRMGGSGMGRLFRGLLFAGLGLGLMALCFPAAIGGCCTALAAGLCCGAAAGAAASQHHQQQQHQNHNMANPNVHSSSHYSSGGTAGGAYYPTQADGSFMASSQGQYDSNYKMGKTSEDFENCTRRAKHEVESASNIESHNGQSQFPSPPYSGPYSTSYVDSTTSVQHNATMNLHFSADFRGQGYKLSGDGHDIDGNTVIEDGHVNYDGTAWWRERNVSGDVGLQVLSRGTFDFSHRTFQGTWMANSGEHGSYITFRATEMAQSHSTGGSSIPVVLASEHHPSPHEPLANTTSNGIPVVLASDPHHPPSTTSSQPILVVTATPVATQNHSSYI